MEFIFEIILQFLGELLLQMVFELLIELGFHGMADTVKKPRDPVLSSIGISLLIFPASLIHSANLRAINLVATPLAIGAIMMLIGKARDRKGQTLVKLDRFGYAFAFAFSMSLVRFVAAG
jgi:hypothetical protein